MPHCIVFVSFSSCCTFSCVFIVSVLVAGLPDKAMGSYRAVMDWFFSMLTVYGHRLAEQFEFHGDYEVGMRTSTETAAILHGYRPKTRQERFHLIQMIIKQIGKNHLRGAYSFTDKGSGKCFNEYRYTNQLLLVANLLPIDGQRSMYGYLPGQITAALKGISSKLKTPSVVLLAGDAKFWTWFENTISGNPGSRYTLQATNGFRQSIRTSNKMESMHNKMKKAVGVHNNLWDFSSGMQKLENQNICDYMMHEEQQDTLKLTKQQKEIENKTCAVWDTITTEIAKNDGDASKIATHYWVQKCIELQDIHYGGRSPVSTLAREVFAELDMIAQSSSSQT